VDLRFDGFTVDDQARTLRRGSEPVHLSPKALDLLLLLLRRRPAAVSKQEIHEALWPDTFVSDGNVAVLIAEIRDAVDDNAQQQHVIRTVPRFGYAFAAPVTRATAAANGHSAAACWLTWGEHHATLLNGENLLGRDPNADIRIDAVGVSRRHAMVIVAEGEATLHDLSSKNGTYVADRRVSDPVPLEDGMQFRLGPATVCFRRVAAHTSTQTVNTSRLVRNRR